MSTEPLNVKAKEFIASSAVQRTVQCPIPIPSEVNLVIYHRDCNDGFGSALAAWILLGDKAVYMSAAHNESAPDVTGKHVAICDFSYSRRIINGMRSRAASLIVLDHHDTAAQELEGLDNCVFDMSKSGAVLAYEFFHPGKPIPTFFLHIEDRDLWLWRMEGTRELMVMLDLEPKTFEVWFPFCDPDNPEVAKQKIEDAITEGTPILAYIRNQVERQASRAVLKTIRGKKVMVVNSNQWISETGNVVAENNKDNADMALIWYYDHGRRVTKCSLRSVRDEVHVGQFARKFRGGGHPRSAGFKWYGNIESLFDPSPTTTHGPNMQFVLPNIGNRHHHRSASDSVTYNNMYSSSPHGTRANSPSVGTRSTQMKRIHRPPPNPLGLTHVSRTPAASNGNK